MLGRKTLAIEETGLEVLVRLCTMLLRKVWSLHAAALKEDRAIRPWEKVISF